jgi:hypothetical protein
MPVPAPEQVTLPLRWYSVKNLYILFIQFTSKKPKIAVPFFRAPEQPLLMTGISATGHDRKSDFSCPGDFPVQDTCEGMKIIWQGHGEILRDRTDH